MRWLFYFLLSSSALLNPQERSAGTFQRGYWIFYWQASTKELVPIVTICRSLSLGAYARRGAVSLPTLSLLRTMPCWGNPPIPMSLINLFVDPWQFCLSWRMNKYTRLRWAFLTHYQAFRKVPAALSKNSSGTMRKELPAKLWVSWRVYCPICL